MTSLPPPGGLGSPPPPAFNPAQATSCWPVPPEYAGFGNRLGAAFVDGLIAFIPASIVAMALDGRAEDLVSEGLPFVIGLALALMAAITGQSPGQRMAGISLLKADGSGPIGAARGIGRFLMAIGSALPLYLGYFWMLWDKPRRQTWHDKVVHSVVVKA